MRVFAESRYDKCGMTEIKVTLYQATGNIELLTRSLVKPHVSPSPSSPPVKGGEIIKPLSRESYRLAGEGKGEGVWFYL